MERSLVRRTWRMALASRLSVSAGGVAACALLATSPALAAPSLREVMKEPTTLVLKDGRIAQVAIYVVPFKPGTAELDSETRNALGNLVETLATDCFLTAQSIGHIEAEAANGSDPLAPHRLARARADRIQAALVERGFASTTIASVWDWRFQTREPRVTLWVFKLNVGEDCTGKPIERATPVVAQPGSIEREIPTRIVESSRTTPAVPPKSDADRAPVAARPVAPPTIAAGRPASAEPARAPAAVPAAGSGATASGAYSLFGGPVAASSAPAPASAAAAPAAPVQIAPAAPTAEPTPAAPPVVALKASEAPAPKAAESGAKSTEPVPATSDRASVPGDESNAEIVFDLNSSFFSAIAKQNLKQLMADVKPGSSWTVELVGAVGGNDSREVASGDNVAYNRWIAERRVGRVAEWLRSNAAGRRLDIRTSYQENDASRRVIVRLRPLR